jgi:cupin 2 domain-containing protein
LPAEKEHGVPGRTGNLFAEVPQRLASEELCALLTSSCVRIERIVSTGQASPPGFWYDQDWREWVLLLAGSAGLKLEGEAEVRTLRPGDYIDIPARRRHRVEWTDCSQPTVWLAVHIAEPTP